MSFQSLIILENQQALAIEIYRIKKRRMYTRVCLTYGHFAVFWLQRLMKLTVYLCHI